MCSDTLIISMKKRLLYALLFGIPGILWSLLVTAIIFGVLSGFL